MTENIPVLYIGGMTRSGSTILGRLLGELPEAVNIGELGLFTTDRFQKSARCECRETVAECDFWHAVFARAFGGLNSLDWKALEETRNEYRLRTLPNLLLPRTAQQQQRLQDYLDVLTALYSAIREVSGAKIIVDASKDYFYGHLLNQVPAIDLHLVHLVRDSRAVAYSYQRVKKDPPTVTNPGYIPQVSPVLTALHWNAANGLLCLKANSPRFMMLRYEDFVADPAETLRRLWDLMGEPPPSLEFLSESPLHLRQGHTVAGNPDRFQSEVKIQPDIEWQQKMRRRDRRVVTALTSALLLRYGYFHRSPQAKPKRFRTPRVL